MLIGGVQAAISIASTAVNMLSGRDPERKASTDEAFKRAVAGDPNALLFLKQRTGDYPLAVVPGYGAEPLGGWGSPNAKAYAQEKYAEALRQLKIMGQVTKVEAEVAGTAKTAAREAGYEIVPQWLVWAALAVVVGVIVMGNRKAA